jgi:hypothetical protein
MPPAELCRTDPVCCIVVTLASSIARTVAPFHSAQSGRSEHLQEGAKAVVRLEAGSLAALVRFELRRGSFLEDKVGV